MKKMRAIVNGRVQGVGYRYYVRNAAKDLGLVGFVRNMVDDSVEVEAEGPPEKLEELRQHLLRGPALARVVDVRDDFTDATGEFTSFEIRH